MERKLLCIADNSNECKTAVLFAAKRASLNGGKLVIFKAIERPENSLISAIGDAIMEDLRIEAMEKMASLANFAKQNCDIEAQTIIREGDFEQELALFIDEDPEIKTLFLACGTSKMGAGTIISAATRGAMNLGKRKIAVMIIPAGLNEDEILELAGR